MKKLIDIIPYEKTNFKFIIDHYDIHLEGTCIYNNKLCYFITIFGEWNIENESFNDDFCEIYKLNFFQRIYNRYSQWLFERFVGYCSTYKNGKINPVFYYRKPKWLFVFLCNLYYVLPNFK